MGGKSRGLYNEEDGNVLIFSAAVMIVLILFLGLAVDFGLYIIKFEGVRSVAQVAIEDASSMTGYYASVPDPASEFSNAVSGYVSAKGGSMTAVASMGRSYSGPPGNEEADIDATVTVIDSYHTIFMRVIGINTLPVKVTKNASSTFFLGKRWMPGMPEETWVP